MKPRFFLLLFAQLSCWGQLDTIAGHRIGAHVRFLAHDLLEGRGPGTRGGHLTEEYIAAQFAAAGLRPGSPEGTFFQTVPLSNVEVLPGAKLTLRAGALTIEPKWVDEFVGTSYAQMPQVQLDTVAIFAGHGIRAPEFGWDDYAGLDVRGKTVILFTGEPPSDDPKFFAGGALTYYGRWTYKYEEAARQGAAAVLIVHTTPTASYGWQVLRSSGRATPMVTRQGKEPALAFAGWVTEAVGERLFSAEGETVAGMLKRADARGFRGLALKARVHLTMRTRVSPIAARNVVGKVIGSDPASARQAVVFSAHWDHLGLGEPVQGDRIYNGAVDNATGVAMLIEMARAWAAQPIPPRRTAIFVAVTAEESGLLGSTYFAANPPVPARDIAANLNFDSFSPYGRVRDAVLNGHERTTLKSLVESVAKRFQLTLKPDPRPAAGSYYRSDHFAFARIGVPAFSVNMGGDYIGRTPEEAAALRKRSSATYHQPSDEYRDDWIFSGMEAAAKFGFALGMEIANQSSLPTWQSGDEFLAARERSLREVQ